MLAAEFGRFKVPAQCAPNSFHPVGNDSFAIARSAQDNSSFAIAARDGLRDGPDKKRVIDGLCGISAEVSHGVTEFLEQVTDLLFVFKACVVRADADFHGATR